MWRKWAASYHRNPLKNHPTFSKGTSWSGKKVSLFLGGGAPYRSFPTHPFVMSSLGIGHMGFKPVRGWPFHTVDGWNPGSTHQLNSWQVEMKSHEFAKGFSTIQTVGGCFLGFLKHQALGGGNSNIFYFHPYMGKWSNLTIIFFQMGGSTTKKNGMVPMLRLTLRYFLWYPGFLKLGPFLNLRTFGERKNQTQIIQLKKLFINGWPPGSHVKVKVG